MNAFVDFNAVKAACRAASHPLRAANRRELPAPLLRGCPHLDGRNGTLGGMTATSPLPELDCTARYGRPIFPASISARASRLIGSRR